MNNAVIAMGLIMGLSVLLAGQVKNYFSAGEWQNKLDLVNPELPPMLDKLRFMYGKPIAISGNNEAVARHLGDSTSQHNVDKWGQSNAVDFFPMDITQDEIPRFIALMQQVGFTGIGVYLDTSQIMFHGDIRADRTAANPATWARINGQYVGIEKAFA